MAKRTIEKWNNQFLIVQKTFESISELYEIGGEKLVTEACVDYRNPVVFDNVRVYHLVKNTWTPYEKEWQYIFEVKTK